jgi:hypothetical protein
MKKLVYVCDCCGEELNAYEGSSIDFHDAEDCRKEAGWMKGKDPNTDEWLDFCSEDCRRQYREDNK